MQSFFVWNIDPVIFHLGFLELRYYGLLFAGGIFAAYFKARSYFRQLHYDELLLDKLVLYLVIGIVLGAHLVHLVFYEPSAFYENPVRILQLGMGLSSHGGGLGAIMGGWLFSRKYGRQISFYQAADIVVVGGALTTSFIRLGNFFNSEIIGRPSDVPWAMVFARVDFLPRHPSQLYEALMGIFLFAVLVFAFKRLQPRRPDGFIFYLFLGLYFSMRFVVEFFKENQSEFLEAERYITMGQWLSLPFVALSLYMLLVRGLALNEKKQP